MASKDDILANIDRAIDPSRMSIQDAINWLEELITELEMRIDGMKDDLRNQS